jgi:hypothetical protein
MISKGFKLRPRFLWITLLICCPEACQSLENQGFGWNAQKKSKVQNPYKSITYGRYWFCSELGVMLAKMAPRLPKFVHKFRCRAWMAR